MCVIQIAGVLLLAAGAQTPPEEPSNRNLLPTATLERQIRTLPDAVRPLNDRNAARAVKNQFAKVRRAIGEFVARQIEVYLSISKCELQKQLADAFARDDGTCNGKWRMYDTVIPRVFTQSWGPGSKRRVFVVAYCIWLGFYGPGGYETVLESYVWERGGTVHRGASIIPAGLSGIGTDMDEVCWFPDTDRYWVLASGTMSGASGRALGGTAAVLEVGPEGASTVWSAPRNIGNVSAHAHARDLRWEIQYVDMKRFYSDLPHATLLDIYRVVWSTRTYRRLVHQPID